jgi:hypothetical protein
MKKILIPFCFLLAITMHSQRQITLKQAIEIAQKKSPEYKTLINQNQASYWRFRNFKALTQTQLLDKQMIKVKTILCKPINLG